VLDHTQKVRIKLPPARTDPVRGRAAVVNLQPLRGRSQLLQAGPAIPGAGSTTTPIDSGWPTPSFEYGSTVVTEQMLQGPARVS